MGAIVRRAILPALLVIGGLASLIYGAMFRSVPVLEERQTKTTIQIPMAFPPEGPPGEPFPPGGPPFGGPQPFLTKTVTRIDLVTVVESEPELIREVSVGGVALLDSGELKRTYSGKGPALCPS
jgi:hypothetical protein